MKVDIGIGGFGPDLNITASGNILSSDDGFIPTVNGISPLPTLVSVGLPALASEARGAAVARKLDDSRRIFVGTQTKLYEASGLSYTDVSKGGGSYTGGAEALWRFAQFGNDTMTTNNVTVTGVGASVNTVSSSGAPTIDINESGTTILSTKITIDANEKTSLTAATAPVISDAAIAAGNEVGIDIDTAGTGAKGLKVWILYKRTS